MKAAFESPGSRFGNRLQGSQGEGVSNLRLRATSDEKEVGRGINHRDRRLRLEVPAAPLAADCACVLDAGERRSVASPLWLKKPYPLLRGKSERGLYGKPEVPFCAGIAACETLGAPYRRGRRVSARAVWPRGQSICFARRKAPSPVVSAVGQRRVPAWQA